MSNLEDLNTGDVARNKGSNKPLPICEETLFEMCVQDGVEKAVETYLELGTSFDEIMEVMTHHSYTDRSREIAKKVHRRYIRQSKIDKII